MSDIGDRLSTGMPALATARSLLFAPGSDERKLRKALEAGADAVVADLEDAVVTAEKAHAREIVADVLAARAPCLRLVRVNAAGSPWLEATSPPWPTWASTRSCCRRRRPRR